MLTIIFLVILWSIILWSPIWALWALSHIIKERLPYSVKRPYNSRSNRGTYQRYVEASNKAVRYDGKLWPRRWVFFGPRVLPVAIFLQSHAKITNKLNKDRNRLTNLNLELVKQVAACKRKIESRGRYIDTMKNNLAVAASLNITVHEYLNEDRKRIQEYRNEKTR